MKSFKTIGAALMLATSLILPSALAAQTDFPTKPIQLIVPSKPGGDTDLNARILAKHAAAAFSQPVVVVNTDGGGGNVAAHKLADSAPDGHTILMLNTVLLTGRALGTLDLGLDDFEVIGIPLYSDTLIWVSRKDAGFANMEELGAAVLANPDTVKFAATVGAPSHLQAIAYEEATGGDLKKIDTGSGSDKIVAVLSGQVDVLTTNYALVKDYVTNGDMVILGNMGRERSAFLPDTASFGESGVNLGPDFNMFYVLLAPKGTPEDVLNALGEGFQKIATNEDAVKDLTASFLTINWRDGPAARAWIAEREPAYMALQDAIKADKF